MALVFLSCYTQVSILRSVSDHHSPDIQWICLDNSSDTTWLNSTEQDLDTVERIVVHPLRFLVHLLSKELLPFMWF